MQKVKIRFTKLAMGGRKPEYNGHPGQVLEVPREYAEQLFKDRAAVPVDAKTYKAEKDSQVETAEAPRSRVEQRRQATKP